jgi:hypothetical protein
VREERRERRDALDASADRVVHKRLPRANDPISASGAPGQKAVEVPHPHESAHPSSVPEPLQCRRGEQLGRPRHAASVSEPRAGSSCSPSRLAAGQVRPSAPRYGRSWPARCSGTPAAAATVATTRPPVFAACLPGHGVTAIRTARRAGRASAETRRSRLWRSARRPQAARSWRAWAVTAPGGRRAADTNRHWPVHRRTAAGAAKPHGTPRPNRKLPPRARPPQSPRRGPQGDG